MIRNWHCKILLTACEGQPRVLRDPAPVSRLMQFSDSGIELELRFWISDPQEGVNNVRSEVNRAIWRLFKEHNITIPMAQREILVRSASSGTRIAETAVALDDHPAHRHSRR